MKLFFFIPILFLFTVTRAQSKADTLVDAIPILCLDEYTPYPEYLTDLNDFEIIYFNRWGEILGKSADRDGNYQDALVYYKPNGEFETIVYWIRYETKEGEKKEIYGHIVVAPYCECG